MNNSTDPTAAVTAAGTSVLWSMLSTIIQFLLFYSQKEMPSAIIYKH